MKHEELTQVVLTAKEAETMASWALVGVAATIGGVYYAGYKLNKRIVNKIFDYTGKKLKEMEVKES